MLLMLADLLTAQVQQQVQLPTTALQSIVVRPVVLLTREHLEIMPQALLATLPTTTSVTVTLTKPQYSAATPAPLVGLLAANFSIENTATNANVPVLTCTESSDGVYVLTYAAVTGTSTFEVTTTVTGYAVPVVSYVDPS